ncbi:hypothetical protein ABVT39_006744 [Epinephelus coioides]
MQGGDFMLATNILLSQINYCKIALLFQFMKMEMVAQSTFFKVQDTNCIEPIEEFWERYRADVVTRMRQKDQVVVLGDGRMDSPDPQRGRYKEWGLQHSLDIWHAAENLGKKLRRAGTVKDQLSILIWIKHIVNHFWYCSNQAVTEEQFKMMWIGVLHHVRNQHVWAMGSCDHEPLDDSSQDKPWIEQDTVQMALSQLLYLLAACRIGLTYPVCGVLIMLADLTNDISPLTLVVMSLERYVAVCYPLRHSAIITIRNTAVAIIVVWIFSLLNILTRVLLLLDFPFEDQESLQLKDYCAKISMFLDPMSEHYDKAYTYFVFVSAGVAVTSSYIGVIIAARSASTDKASARKSRNTLLLHLVQLGLSLVSTMHNSMLIALSRIVPRLVFVRSATVFYVCIFIFPRCLSSLIYGIRDHTIRPVLMYHLCCRLKLSVVSAKVSC